MTNTLLDPTGELSPLARQPLPRLATLDGATIGLLNISKPRGDVFLDRLQSLLEARGAKVERFRKPTFAKNAPFDLRREIAERCDAVLEALAD
jgi:hypothetical protein